MAARARQRAESRSAVAEALREEIEPAVAREVAGAVAQRSMNQALLQPAVRAAIDELRAGGGENAALARSDLRPLEQLVDELSSGHRRQRVESGELQGELRSLRQLMETIQREQASSKGRQLSTAATEAETVGTGAADGATDQRSDIWARLDPEVRQGLCQTFSVLAALGDSASLEALFVRRVIGVGREQPPIRRGLAVARDDLNTQRRAALLVGRTAITSAKVADEDVQDNHREVVKFDAVVLVANLRTTASIRRLLGAA